MARNLSIFMFSLFTMLLLPIESNAEIIDDIMETPTPAPTPGPAPAPAPAPAPTPTPSLTPTLAPPSPTLAPPSPTLPPPSPALAPPSPTLPPPSPTLPPPSPTLAPPSNTTQPQPGTTEGSLQPEDCAPRCEDRCSKTHHKKPCLFFCKKCCAKCLCVPPGTYGNKEVCPCYNNWKTKRGGPKCP